MRKQSNATSYVQIPVQKLKSSRVSRLRSSSSSRWETFRCERQKPKNIGSHRRPLVELGDEQVSFELCFALLLLADASVEQKPTQHRGLN